MPIYKVKQVFGDRGVKPMAKLRWVSNGESASHVLSKISYIKSRD